MPRLSGSREGLDPKTDLLTYYAVEVKAVSSVDRVRFTESQQEMLAIVSEEVERVHPVILMVDVGGLSESAEVIVDIYEESVWADGQMSKTAYAIFKLDYLRRFPDGIDGEYRGCIAPNSAWICPLLGCSTKLFNPLLQQSIFAYESFSHYHHRLDRYCSDTVIITHGCVEFYVKPILHSASHLRPVT